MLEIINNGVHLVEGRTLINGTEAEQKAQLEAMGLAPRNDRNGTLAYSVLNAHNTRPGDEKMRVKFDALISHDITYVGIIQTARASGLKEFPIPYNGIDVKICVASGLANARKVLESVKSGEKEYHFIEVMACPGGCVMGGGQPIGGTKVQRAETRTKGLYAADGDMVIKKSNENPLMDVFYNGYFKGKAHELLHNHHE